MRDDIAGRHAPRHLRRLLERRYGTTPWCEPLYRLVWAPARLERSGGLWSDWRGGTQAAGQGLMRRVHEIRWVRKYPGETCWLVERWTPPAAYGAPADWPARALGPFPARGDYEDTGARRYWYPCERHLTLAIDASRRRLRSSAGADVAGAVARAEARQSRRDAEFEAFCHDVLGEASMAFAGAPMTGYGPKARPSLVTAAETAGIRQHPY